MPLSELHFRLFILVVVGTCCCTTVMMASPCSAAQSHYKGFNEDITLSQAQQKCKRSGGWLASIASWRQQSEVNLAARLAGMKGLAFIGGFAVCNQQNPASWTWLDGPLAEQTFYQYGELSWSGGKVRRNGVRCVIYCNWKENPVDESLDYQRYVAVNTSDTQGRWVDGMNWRGSGNPYKILPGYICQYGFNVITTTVSHTKPSTSSSLVPSATLSNVSSVSFSLSLPIPQTGTKSPPRNSSSCTSTLSTSIPITHTPSLALTPSLVLTATPSISLVPPGVTVSYTVQVGVAASATTLAVAGTTVGSAASALELQGALMIGMSGCASPYLQSFSESGQRALTPFTWDESSRAIGVLSSISFLFLFGFICVLVPAITMCALTKKGMTFAGACMTLRFPRLLVAAIKLLYQGMLFESAMIIAHLEESRSKTPLLNTIVGALGLGLSAILPLLLAMIARRVSLEVKYTPFDAAYRKIPKVVQKLFLPHGFWDPLTDGYHVLKSTFNTCRGSKWIVFVLFPFAKSALTAAILVLGFLSCDVRMGLLLGLNFISIVLMVFLPFQRARVDTLSGVIQSCLTCAVVVTGFTSSIPSHWSSYILTAQGGTTIFFMFAHLFISVLLERRWRKREKCEETASEALLVPPTSPTHTDGNKVASCTAAAGRSGGETELHIIGGPERETRIDQLLL